MSVATQISEEEYLRTSYSPEPEFRDGVLVERGMPGVAHSNLQTGIGCYCRNREEEWNVHVYVELTIRARKGWLPIPDVCIYLPPEPEGNIADRVPFLWIEIVSPSDKLSEVWDKAREAVACGTQYVWTIDPKSLDSDLWTASGRTAIADRTLRIPDSPIVIPLDEVLKKKR